MVFALLTFGTAWFWLFLAVPFLLLTWLVEVERGYTALWVVIVAMGAYLLFGDPKVLVWVKDNPLLIVAGALAYVVVGIAWGFCKWFFFLLKARDAYTKVRDAYFASLKTTGNPDGPFTVQGFEAFWHNRKYGLLGEQEHHRYTPAPPRAAQNASRIIFWMSYWPVSAAWTLLHDPITRFYRFLYRRLGKAFEGMSDKMFAAYADDRKDP